MAFVTLISGVCSVWRHIPHHHVADETGQHEHREVPQEGRWRIGADEPEGHGSNRKNNGQGLGRQRSGSAVAMAASSAPPHAAAGLGLACAWQRAEQAR
jgi:hypothetical protein